MSMDLRGAKLYNVRMSEDFYGRKFIKATRNYATYEENVPAPIFRRRFECKKVQKTTVLICGLGFYRIFINGSEFTDGALATHVYNPDDLLYYDRYDVTEYTRDGENVIAVMLGNGFLNNVGGKVWQFDEAPFRDAPKFAINVYADGQLLFEADEKFVCRPSAILFDDMRSGEIFDARLYDPSALGTDCDETGWTKALPASAPKGEMLEYRGERIRYFEAIEPKSVIRKGNKLVYDFGKCVSGVCRVKIRGKRGKTVSLVHYEMIDERGEPYLDNITFPKTRKDRFQRVDFVCSGGDDEYLPSFTYFCFRYVSVFGVSDAERDNLSLEAIVMHADVKTAGGFNCDDEIANKIQSMVRSSDLSAFFHFPNDCSHREKNGWTADAALSIEQMLLNFDAGRLFAEWYRSIVAAQRADGAVPCIVPTSGYGFGWGNGPAWDSVIAYIPYYLYKYYGDREILELAAPALGKYVSYLGTLRKENGLIEKGLSDWCEVTDDDTFSCSSSLESVSTLVAADIAAKAEFLLSRVEGFGAAAREAGKLNGELIAAFRAKRIHKKALKTTNFTQCVQAMAIEFGAFAPEEKAAAAKNLAELVRAQGEKMKIGVWGSRVLFRVLADYGYADLAWKAITRTDEKSYGYMAERDWNTLWEKIVHAPKDMRFKYSRKSRCTSYNHHFWGDVSAFFIRYACGINVNPYGDDPSEVLVAPKFVSELGFAEAEYCRGSTRVSVRWERRDGKIFLTAMAGADVKLIIDAPEAEVTIKQEDKKQNI